MAAYAATVTLSQLVIKKLPNGLAVLRGLVDVTNYNTARAEITGITGRFKGAPTVLLGGATDNGYIVAWDAATESIKAWYPTQQTAGAGNRAGVEVANDVDVGAVPFVAFGVAP